MSSFLKLGSIYHAIYGWAHLSGVVAAALALMRRMDELHLGFRSAGGSSLQRNDAGVWLCEYPRTVFSALSGMRLLACLIVAPQRGYDEPAILPYAISSFCPTSAAASEQ